MRTALIALLLAAATAFGQFSAKPGGAPPSELAPEMAAGLQQQGIAILSGGQPYSELWFRTQVPSGPETSENFVTWKTVPHGSYIGVIRYAVEGKDRRGQAIKPGIYTLRLSYFPVDGAHQGVEPTRDFLILSPADSDKDPNAAVAYEALMDMSRKVTGGRHPACLAMWKAESEFQEGLAQLGEHDWVLGVKIGNDPISLIVSGINEHDR
ncbi:MAG: hypothetical protein KIT09_22300 [Bryobacteraceae bacterium]|nr:hypothetical protein [Bryobacteraceae bacterium]